MNWAELRARIAGDRWPADPDECVVVEGSVREVYDVVFEVSDRRREGLTIKRLCGNVACGRPSHMRVFS